MKKTTLPPALTETSAARLAVLVASFPCLAGRPGVAPLDVEALARFATTEPAEETPAHLDAATAASFVVWLYERGLHHSTIFVDINKKKHPAIVEASTEFKLEELALWGFAETRAIVAAWLAAPWLPEAAKA